MLISISSVQLVREGGEIMRKVFLVIMVLHLILQVSSTSAAIRTKVAFAFENMHYLPLVSKPLKDVPPGSFSISLLAQLGGSSKAVSVVGDYAYIGIGARLEILDIKDLSKPIVIGQSGILADAIRNLDISGNYVYISAGLDGGLIVIDITDTEHPVQMGNYDTQCVAEDVDVVGNFAYVACATRGLMVFDVSNPNSPKLKGSYDTQSLAEGIFVEKNLAYVADYYSGLQIIDISNPSGPILVGSFSTITASDVYVIDKIAYVSDAMSGLYIVDVKNPAIPTLLGSYTAIWPNDYEYYYNVKVFNQIAYIADQNDGLRIVDVSQPTSPKLLGVFPSGGDTMRVDIVGDVAFVADRNSGVNIIDVSEPSSPTALGLFSTSTVNDVSVNGKDVNLATGNGLEVFDISDHTDPVYKTSYRTPGTSSGVDAQGSLVYILWNSNGAFSGGLIIIDVQNPNTPELIGTYPMDTSLPTDISLGYKLAYVVHRNWTGGGLKIFDISDPSNPNLIGSLDNIINAQNLSIWGDIAHISAWEGGLKIVDIYNPTDPKLLSSHVTQSYARDVSAVRNMAYVSDYYGGLEIIDVTDPNSPSLIRSYEETCELSEGVIVAGNLAYMVTAGSLQIIDVTNPQTANFRGSFPIPGKYSSSGFSRKVKVVNDIIYVASGQEGLFILKATPPIR